MNLKSPDILSDNYSLPCGTGQSGDPFFGVKKLSMRGVSHADSVFRGYITGCSDDDVNKELATIGVKITSDGTTSFKLANDANAHWDNSIPPGPLGESPIMHLRFYINPSSNYKSTSATTVMLNGTNSTYQVARQLIAERAFTYHAYDDSRRQAQSGWRTLSIPLRNATVFGKTNIDWATMRLQLVQLSGASADVGSITLDSIWFTRDLLNTHPRSPGPGVMIFMDDCVDGPPGENRGEFTAFCTAAYNHGIKLILPWIDWAVDSGGIYRTCTEVQMLAAISQGHEIMLHSLNPIDSYDYATALAFFRQRQDILQAWGRANGLDLSENVRHYVCAGNYLNPEVVRAARECFDTFWALSPFAPYNTAGNDTRNCGLALPTDPMCLWRLAQKIGDDTTYELARTGKIIGDGHISPVYYHRVADDGTHEWTPAQWEALMAGFETAGYRSYTCKDLVRAWRLMTERTLRR